MRNFFNLFKRKTISNPEKTSDTSPLSEGERGLGEVGSGKVGFGKGGSGEAQFTSKLNQWDWLDYFLLFGSESATYYAIDHDLTKEFLPAVRSCIQEDGLRAVHRIVEISESGRAPKNDPALFALALAASDPKIETRQAALKALPRVARTGTHLLRFMQYIDAMRGWGRSLQTAVAAWYTSIKPESLVGEFTNSHQRGNWTHRDALRLAHPTAHSAQQNTVFHWISQGWTGVHEESSTGPVVQRIWALEHMQSAASEDEVVRLLAEHGLPLDAVPLQWLASPKVWEALLPHLTIDATLANLGRMTASGLLVHDSYTSRFIVNSLLSKEALISARINPISILSALRKYERGYYKKRLLIWEPVQEIVLALENAFYLSFGNVERLGKRIMLTLNISGSMRDHIKKLNLPALEAAAAMILITAEVEKDPVITVFTSPGQERIFIGSFSYLTRKNGLSKFDIQPDQKLDNLVEQLSRLPFGGADYALPINSAKNTGLKIDLFCIYTDYDEVQGTGYASAALEDYRQVTGIPAKLVIEDGLERAYLVFAEHRRHDGRGGFRPGHSPGDQ